jgi:hypothetical protein
VILFFLLLHLQEAVAVAAITAMLEHNQLQAVAAAEAVSKVQDKRAQLVIHQALHLLKVSQVVAPMILGQAQAAVVQVK